MDGQVGVAVPAPRGRAGGPLLRVLLDHAQVCVQRDAHGGIKGNLECGAHVLRTDHGAQLLGVHSVEALREQLGEIVLVLLDEGLGWECVCVRGGAGMTDIKGRSKVGLEWGRRSPGRKRKEGCCKKKGAHSTITCTRIYLVLAFGLIFHVLQGTIQAVLAWGGEGWGGSIRVGQGKLMQEKVEG